MDYDLTLIRGLRDGICCEPRGGCVGGKCDVQPALSTPHSFWIFRKHRYRFLIFWSKREAESEMIWSLYLRSLSD